MYPKEIYNFLGVGKDPMKNVAMATVFSEILGFWDFVLKTYCINFG